MQIKVGISVCPNDIFSYSGMLTSNIEHDYDFQVAQIGVLNQLVEQRKVDICKMSAGSYLQIKNEYSILPVGASFGVHSGPKLVFERQTKVERLETQTIAVPGLTTTGARVLKFFYPDLELIEAGIEEIPSLVKEKHVLGGLVINESMGQLEKYGLKIHLDIAELWFRRFNSFLPLGVVVARRSLDQKEREAFVSRVNRSICWAQDNPDQSLDCCKKWSVETQPSALKKHIKLFAVQKIALDLKQKSLEVFESALDS